MRKDGNSDRELAAELKDLIPHLDERHRRLVLGARAKALGDGGISRIARIAGVHPSTVSRGVAELDANAGERSRIRRAGAGRKPLTVSDPGLVDSLLALFEPAGQGGPAGAPLTWTTKSTRSLAEELAGCGHRASAWSVANLLREAGFRLRTGAGHRMRAADRERRFARAHDQARAHLAERQPVLAATTCKHEFTGETWTWARPDRDTAAFTAATIRGWWERGGGIRHPAARRMLVVVDGAAVKTECDALWRAEFAGLAADTGLLVTVCHLPAGTVRWNGVTDRIATDLTLQLTGSSPTRHEVGVSLIEPRSARAVADGQRG